MRIAFIIRLFVLVNFNLAIGQFSFSASYDSIIVFHNI